jgi:hypothetical protein
MIFLNMFFDIKHITQSTSCLTICNELRDTCKIFRFFNNMLLYWLRIRNVVIETAASVICLLFDSSAPRLCPIVKRLGREHVWPPHQPAPHLVLPVTAVRQDGNLRSPWSVRQFYKTIRSEKSQLISHKAMNWFKCAVGYFWYSRYQTKTP